MRKLIIRSCNVVLCCAVYIQSLQLVQMGGLRLASPVGTTLAAEVGPERRSLDNSEKERQEQEWGTFRLAFPYHFQTIAISNRYGDGTRTLIVSEPPPHCEAARIEALLPDGSSAIEIKTHTVGHDGWVKDLVTTLPRSMTNEARTALVRKLSEYLFHTDYGAYFLPLPVAKRAVEKKYPLDLRVGVAELKQWVVDGNFHTADNTPAGKLANLLDTGGGLFFGKDWGLVVWVIPKGTDIDACRADMRRFALDSDLILGAVKVADKGVVIVGRERVVPITVLPPLRGETIALLAGAKTKELGQSYERTAPFAGKFRGP